MLCFADKISCVVNVIGFHNIQRRQIDSHIISICKPQHFDFIIQHFYNLLGKYTNRNWEVPKLSHHNQKLLDLLSVRKNIESDDILDKMKHHYDPSVDLSD